MLTQIHDPADLKAMSQEQLALLCREIRRKIIDTVSKTGGHLSSNLGVVELTVAIHRMFHSPDDKLVWDVGHQCYAHKLLTGRINEFSTLRQEDGISGFPKPWENVHDSFVAGHASTSLSAACGLARAELLKGTNNMVIAVIGDGALTGGMAYEALNNAAGLSNLIIILNYNEMSISKTMGGFAKYLSSMRSRPTYLSTRQMLNKTLDQVPIVGRLVKKGIDRSKLRIKNALYDSNLFTDFGFSYLGPVDGHSLSDLHDALNWAKQTERPALIQVFTKKGKGYSYAEQDPERYHGVSAFDISSGEPIQPSQPSFSSAFGEELCRLAQQDRRICAVTAAMKSATGLSEFALRFPSRFFDVGIAEEHAVTFAAGMAQEGLLPVFAVYSTFLQRGYDQILHDVAIQNQHMLFAVDRAGIVGDDGETHQGIFDTAFLSTIPNMTIYSPSNFAELKAMLFRAAYDTEGMVAVRYPRGTEPEYLPSFAVPAADFQLTGEGSVLLITYGRLAGQAYAAQKLLSQRGIEAAILKLGRIHPIPESAVRLAADFPYVYFFEEGIQSGGIGEQFAARLLSCGYGGQWNLFAVPDRFIPQCSISRALEVLGLDCAGMVQSVLQNAHVHVFGEKRR